MRSAIILLMLGALWAPGVAACASPRYAASTAEAERRETRGAKAKRKAAGAEEARASRSRKADEPRLRRRADVETSRSRRTETRAERRAREREEAADEAYAKKVLGRRGRGGRGETPAASRAERAAAATRAPPRAPAAPPPVSSSVQRTAAAAPGRPTEIIVEDGESVFDVAGRFSTSVRAIAELNGLEPPYDLPSGLRLKVPPRTPPVRYAGPAPTRPPVLTPAPESLPRGVTAPDLGESTAVVARRSRTEADALAAVAVASTRAPPALPTGGPPARFAWPLKGAVLSAFGPKGPGLRNDGLDLAALPGEAVRAAAAGEVVYAGKEISAFGNLVLLKHAGGWVTAYAHLGRIGVAMRQTVEQGQSIGEAGDSGATDTPRLHFEVRAPSAAGPARPVDPATVLPAG